MKKIELFKRRLTFKIEKQEEEEVEYDISKETILGEKLVYLILIMVVMSMSSKLYLFKPSLKEGDLVRRDIVAPRNLIYNDRNAKDKLIEDIIAQSQKEYIEIPGIEGETLRKVDDFYGLIERKMDEITTSTDGEETSNISRINESALNEILRNYNTIFKQENIDILLNMSENELITSRNRVKDKMRHLYEIGVVKGRTLRDDSKTIDGELKDLPPLDMAVLKNFVQSNYVFDEDTTKTEIALKVNQVEDVIQRVKGGTIIAKKGEILTSDQVSILRAYGLYSFKTNIGKLISFFIFTLAIAIVFYQIGFKFLRKTILHKGKYRATLLIVLVTFLVVRFIHVDFIYMVPLETMFFLLGILVGPQFAVLISSMALLFILPMINFDLVYYLTNMISFLLGLALLSGITNRTILISSGVKLGITKMIIFIFIRFLTGADPFETILTGGSVLLSGIFSGMFTIALLPYFEKTFNLLTTFKLIELGDLSHPLLRALSVNTPGTFHHSMMVATLSENAAEAIGANAIFARVACYYHDIGKMKRPNFYVENQQNKANPHNNLTPTMSNLIIASHTKDGVEMAKEYGIPKEIRNIMIEHQGTTLLAYFYNKAKQSDETVQEADFRYSGPKPRTKESAIIMLADSIEAAVRSLDEKTPVTIEKMIRKIITGKIEDNQLSEADLTFKEIEIIIKTFTSVLMGIHHVRLKYPGQKG